MPKIKLTYSPEGGSAQSWVIDAENPDWDVMYNTEKITDWPWRVFSDKLGDVSAIALQALLFTLRKRDEPRLTLDAVRPELSELDLEVLDDPAPAKKPKKAEGKAAGGESGEA